MLVKVMVIDQSTAKKKKKQGGMVWRAWARTKAQSPQPTRSEAKRGKVNHSGGGRKKKGERIKIPA